MNSRQLKISYAAVVLESYSFFLTISDQVPLIWIHDYHLMLAANTIREVAEEENLSCKIGFFLHIPFPSFDIVKVFPWVDILIQVGWRKHELNVAGNGARCRCWPRLFRGVRELTGGKVASLGRVWNRIFCGRTGRLQYTKPFPKTLNNLLSFGETQPR